LSQLVATQDHPRLPPSASRRFTSAHRRRRRPLPRPPTEAPSALPILQQHCETPQLGHPRAPATLLQSTKVADRRRAATVPRRRHSSLFVNTAHSVQSSGVQPKKACVRRTAVKRLSRFRQFPGRSGLGRDTKLLTFCFHAVSFPFQTHTGSTLTVT